MKSVFVVIVAVIIQGLTVGAQAQNRPAYVETRR